MPNENKAANTESPLPRGVFNQPPTDDRGLIVVGIGSSAGGVEALESLFSVLPDRLGMAYIVVQHLSPKFESLMPQILGRRSKMPVHEISHKQKLERDHVYVLPSGKDLIVSNGFLYLRDQDKSQTVKKPIDSFFSSLANDIGPNAVAIVLSGTGTDGARGIREVHDAGGLVIVQSEHSAKFNGMPRAAIHTGIVDSIASIDEIPDSLIRFSELVTSDSRDSRSALFARTMDAEQRLYHLLHNQFGIDFDLYKSELFGRRVQHRMCLLKEPDFEKYLTRLNSDAAELKRLYSDLLIGVTEFFRDVDAFQELRLRVLPPMLDAAAESGEFRIWVSPCATGEEAYSIAIIIDEILETRPYKLDVKIFATDVNGDCIEFASRGVYPGECVGNVNEVRLNRYFERIDEGYRVVPALRKTIVFAQHNLLDDAPFTKLNLVTCRNLLIYLKSDAKNKILTLFNFSLRSDGVLFLGPSESLAGLAHEFRTLNDKWRIFRKIGNVQLSSVTLASQGNTKTSRPTSSQPAGINHSDLISIYDAVLSEYMPPGLLVDRDNQIVHIFGEATEFLEFKPGRPNADFLHLLPTSFRVAVANGIKRVGVAPHPVVYSGIQWQDKNGNKRAFKITVKATHLTQGSAKYLVTFEEPRTREIPVSEKNPAVPTSNTEERIRFLEEQLQTTRDSLHDSILELKTANEEMQGANEELIASNEELQSTNEELHSINEELYTVSSEHQRKITEMTEMTDDMENLLDSIQVDTIFLDRELKVRKFTLGIAKTFRLIPQDVGRHIDSFNHELLHDDLVGLVESVVDIKKMIEQEVQDKSGNWYLMRLLPYNSRGRVDGVLLTLIDITTIKETEQKLAELSEIVQSSEDAIFRITPDGIIRTWNRGSEMLFSHTSNYMIGKSIHVLSLEDEGKDVIEEALELIRRGNRIEHIQLKAVRRNGQGVDVQMSVSPIYNSEKKLTAASIVLRDFTKQKNNEATSLDAVRRRDQFLAMLSHELRNPIAAIMNALAVLRTTDATSDKDVSARRVIERQAKQLARLLDDLLDVSRITYDKVKLDVKRVDLVELADEVVECIEGRLAEKQQSLTLELPDKPIYIDADSVRVVQAQVNLLVNATKYTPAKGSIRYSISTMDETVVIEVEDDGEGMNEDLKKRVFEVFVQAHQSLDRNVGGMGLGLPLVRMIAIAHNGAISADSAGPGKGSKFTLTLPLSATQPEELEAQTEVPAIDSLRCRKLMLVEDSDGAREMLAEFLEIEGFEVAAAANGIEAVETFEKFEPAICVIDLGLPDLNGFEVVKKIRAMNHKSDLLIALTGYGQEKDKLDTKDAGFDLHLVKPINPEILVNTILLKMAKARPDGPASGSKLKMHSPPKISDLSTS